VLTPEGGYPRSSRPDLPEDRGTAMAQGARTVAIPNYRPLERGANRIVHGVAGVEQGVRFPTGCRTRPRREKWAASFWRRGEAWRTAWRSDAKLGFYGADGFHPTKRGSYLAVLVVYQSHWRTPHWRSRTREGGGVVVKGAVQATVQPLTTTVGARFGNLRACRGFGAGWSVGWRVLDSGSNA
jgi:hypothetical protein